MYPAVLLMGPTASGKTACSLHLSRHLPIEIVSVDSALVYRDMDIGTAKPSRAEQAECPHHLIDIISPAESYSAARFCADATRLIQEVHTRGNLPVLVGGTMLYFKALREGLSDLPRADAALRHSIEKMAHAQGWPAVHAALSKLDPAAAAQLNPNDAQRIQRAYEIVSLSGQSLAENYAAKEKSDVMERIRFLPIALNPAVRSVLHTRIEHRFDAMLTDGLVDEVRHLRNAYALTADSASMRCVGYRQVFDYLDGLYDDATLRAKGIAATRQLAKRQITWLRQFRENWPDLLEIDSLQTHAAETVAHAVLQFSKSARA